MAQADLHAFADFIATLPKPASKEPGDAGRMQKAKDLVTKEHCDSCHNADFSGAIIFRAWRISAKTIWPNIARIQEQYPRRL
jgi:hypothetical protein